MLIRFQTPAPRAVMCVSIAIGIVMIAPSAFAAPIRGHTPQPAETTATYTFEPAPDTRGNLQIAFGNEVNTKTRYEEAAKVADREGYAAVARLFRACARAEQAHADQHVHAIAYTGDEAKAMLEKVGLATTAENLRVAVGLENYEIHAVYPAMIAQARAERMTAAVRSMNYALSAEREHARLLAAALASLEQRPAPHSYFVCGQCGKTVETISFAKCPNCFNGARGFAAID